MRLAPSRRRRDEAPRRERRGFSIIEAIVAVMLLSFGVLALASSAAMTIREMRASSQRVSDAALAATSFERLRSFEKCGVITTKAASISGMTATTVAIPGAPRIINLRYVLPVQAGVRKTSQEYRSSVPCVL
ncbi:MAG: prepilin-type N-terminal cleavage/methylation domain-containing protein [Gemmatimonadaceae bacterium]|nr:prepilin-type N-terminal cleavage/methylation domain-containing protein [Gemmatimonadaceae bacterium]